ncbi:MAG: UDP-N-acetylmuramyl pentapeptide phosphotransferase/UDP-N-acetylglucosamine-1-phosphate transferase [Akkermansiaceae bacterium]|jgi:UDP-N-acetylmuramyl pentapeptide phosphotransferase/UDP-N-acetylglucosamine-1-phosphate transferase
MRSFDLFEAIGLLVSAGLLSLCLTRLMIKVGPSLGLMDEPDARRVHVTPVPRAGGLAIWVSFLTVAWIGNLVIPDLFEGVLQSRLIAFTWASLLLMVVGVLDDRGGMKALVKLGGQIAAAVIFFILDPSLWEAPFFGIDFPVWLLGLLFTGWCVLLINAFNLIDGLDGLCSGLVMISLFVVASLEFTGGNSSEALIILVMAAAVAGFMRYNLNPARIFLGDAGSMMLGFFLATAATQAGGRRAVIGSIVLPIAIAGVPLLDVLLAVWRRSARNQTSRKQGGEKVGVFSPDKDHLHHRFLALGLSQRKVALILQGVAVSLALLCFIPMILGGRGLVVTLCGIVILGLFGLRHFAKVELLHTGSLLHLAVKRRQGAGATRALYYLYDILVLTLAASAAVVIETNFGMRDDRGVWSLGYLILFVTCEVVILQVVHFYRRVWSRASSREFFIVAMGLTIGGIITSTIYSGQRMDVSWSDFRCGFMASQIAIWLVLIPRALPDAIREFAVDTKHRKLRKAVEGRKHVLVYGAGTVGNLFVNFLKSCAPDEFDEFQISGFLDENRNLKNRSIQGFKIHGDLAELKSLKGKFSVHGIIVTISEISEVELGELVKKAEDHGIVVYRWEANRMPWKVERSTLQPL